MAWGFLSAGIVLGAWWSYEVLGWGGYWAWDPVENASFIPWLTATAYLHSVVVQERRGMLRVWNLSLILATFCLTILGTFLTRSGVINSVHSFTQSAIGPLLLGFLGVAAATGVGLIAWRGDRLRTPGRIDSPVSREGAFLANDLLFAGFAFVVLLGTVFPLLAEALQQRQLSVGEPYFDQMTLPIGLALLFLMAVAPALPWRAASGEVLRGRLAGPAWAGALTMAAAAATGARGVAQLVAFGLGAFAVAGIVRQYRLGVVARRRSSGEGWPAALRSTVAGNRRLYGGLVVHSGIVVIAVALAASSGYSTKREFQMRPGERVAMAGHRFTYLGSEETETGQKRTLTARVRVDRGGKSLGVYEPALSIFPNMAQAIGTPSVRTSLLRDVYLTLVLPDADGQVNRASRSILWWCGCGSEGDRGGGHDDRRLARPPEPPGRRSRLHQSRPGTARGAARRGDRGEPPVNLRRLLPVLALAAVVVATLVLGSASGDGDPSPAARTRRLAAGLRCPVCQGLSVADSPSPTARAISDDIRRRVDAGESDGAIRQAYVERYGEWVLYNRPGAGSGRWCGPCPWPPWCWPPAVSPSPSAGGVGTSPAPPLLTTGSSSTAPSPIEGARREHHPLRSG